MTTTTDAGDGVRPRNENKIDVRDEYDKQEDTQARVSGSGGSDPEVYSYTRGKVAPGGERLLFDLSRCISAPATTVGF